MVAYVIGLVLLTILDSTPSPFGGEGNRLALLLLAPVDGAAILWVKFSGVVPLLLFEGLALSLILGLWRRMPPGDLLFASAVMALIIVGVTGLITWGSAWDINLDLPIEESAQALIHERMPSTPCRIVFLTLACMLAAALLIVFWRLPPLSGLVVATGSVALVLLVSWRIGRAGLHQALRG
jgi:hypothetical protein